MNAALDPSSDNLQTPCYLLLLGAPRSGTTLLAAMIGCHDQVAMLNEDRGMTITRIVGKRVVGNKLCTPNQIEIDRTRPQWTQMFGNRGFQRLHNWGYFRFKPESPVSIKDYLRLEPIRIIGIIRNGDSVISSIMRRGHQPEKVAVHRWSRCIEVLYALHRSIGPQIHICSFEDLVASPQKCMEVIAEFLGLPFQSSMLDGYMHTRAYPSESGIDSSRGAPPTFNRFKLKERYPDVYTKYEKLVALAGTSG